MPRILCVVSCGKKKIWSKHPGMGPVEARKAYIGHYSRLLIKYAETFCKENYVILSAKYGFLWPYEKIPGDYNVTFNDRKTNPHNT